MKSVEKQAEFIQARALGVSLRASAEAVGISKATAERWNKDLAGRISTEHQEALTDLADRFAISKAKRLESIGRTLEGIRKEIQARLSGNLEEVPLGTLLAAQAKFEELAAAEADSLNTTANPLDAATLKRYAKEVKDGTRPTPTSQELAAAEKILDDLKTATFKAAPLNITFSVVEPEPLPPEVATAISN